MPQALTLFVSNLSLVISNFLMEKLLLLLTDPQIQHYINENPCWRVAVTKNKKIPINVHKNGCF